MLNVESGEGKVKELAVTTSSICSIEDCMMLERAFSSAKASCGTLMREDTVKHLNVEGTRIHTQQHPGLWTSLTENRREEDSRWRAGGTLLDDERLGKCRFILLLAQRKQPIIFLYNLRLRLIQGAGNIRKRTFSPPAHSNPKVSRYKDSKKIQRARTKLVIRRTLLPELAPVFPKGLRRPYTSYLIRNPCDECAPVR
jgi:hypothetical protein